MSISMNTEIAGTLKVGGAFTGGKFNKVGQTKSGEVWIELPNGAKVAGVRETIGVVRELQETVTVELCDIDLDNTKAEITEAIQDALPDCENEMVTVEALPPAYIGAQLAVVVLSVAAAGPLLQEGHIKIGWVNARIRGRVSVLICFNCLDYKHMAADCRRRKANFGSTAA
ncbi:hypothetical protein QAD02_003915 [Eretmocerus hayati]|uniref:Uncharacterized protein n=1 Tax=Eretmocerus hayati TaxID=131215 RepID=A0ACC2NPW7_9HYME|nr:hypothetical protein QAD02_003915 [Eretmocerus hayati]